jgi:hypothetical protein
MIILAVYVGSNVYQQLEGNVPKVSASIFCIIIGACFLVWMTQWARRTHQRGQGYANSAYTHSKMLEIIRGLRKDARFYSNLPWPIEIYADRRCELLPLKADDTTSSVSSEYRDEMEDFAETMREKDVYLAYFKARDDWFAFPSIQEMQSVVPLHLVAEAEDGTLYAAAGQ